MNQKSILLTPEFFIRDTRLVARELLGKVIYHRINKKVYKAIITETEAYHGAGDLACHCSKGKTKRTSVMFDHPGLIYIYLIYGIYYMLNIVTMPKNFPAAVLIRAVKNLQVSFDMKKFEKINHPTDGPGKLTKQLQIDGRLNNKLLTPNTGLWVVDEGIEIPADKIQTGKRIGIDYAGKWKDKPWRFYYK